MAKAGESVTVSLRSRSSEEAGTHLALDGRAFRRAGRSQGAAGDGSRQGLDP